MTFQGSFKKAIARVSLIAFVNFILLVSYPGGVRAGENLSISGFEIKTPAFKPYLDELPVNYRVGNREISASSGEFSFFLNKAALVNAEIQDKEFNLVKSLELMQEGKEGENTISWNGRDEQGEFIKSGQYIFSITAMAEDGTSAIISKEVEIEFEAPLGIEFKPRVWEIEGKPKKEYPKSSQVTKTVSDDWRKTCVGGPFGFAILWPLMWGVATIGLLFSPLLCATCKEDRCCANHFGDILDIASFPFSKKLWHLKTVPDYEEYAEIKKEIDEYNAELEAEIAEENKEIDEHNFKIKDAIIIRMALQE